MLAARPELMNVILPTKALSDNGTPADAKDFPALFLLEQASGACGQGADCPELRKDKMEKPLSLQNGDGTAPAVA